MGEDVAIPLIENLGEKLVQTLPDAAMICINPHDDEISPILRAIPFILGLWREFKSFKII